jgi:WD40 repeat protein/DNA-binding SARP family transcriptional activator/class 3 adenylate cyclase
VRLKPNQDHAPRYEAHDPNERRADGRRHPARSSGVPRRYLMVGPEARRFLGEVAARFGRSIPDVRHLVSPPIAFLGADRRRRRWRTAARRFQRFSSGWTEALVVNETPDANATYRFAAERPILSGMGEASEPPQSSDRPDPAEPGRAADLEMADGLRTFLIADIRGYTGFIHERGDEAAGRLSGRFAAIVREQVDDRDGSVIELRGDEALVVFRSPRRAIRAAVELQTRFLEETVARPDLPLQVGIGLDAGEAVVVEGRYGRGALNLAERLCSEAAPGEILASQSVVHLARTIEGIRYLDRGELHLKGLSDTVRVLAIAPEWADVPARMRELAPKQPRRRPFGGRMQFRILGPLEVDSGGGPIPMGGPKQRALLAHLIMRANELVPAETLVDELWGEEPPENARNTIQTYVSHLRKAIGHERIEWRAPGYILRVDPSEVDAARFDGLLRDAKKALAVEPSVAVGVLEEALTLWRGPALAGLADQPSLLAEATRLEDLRLEAQEARIDGLLATGAHARAIADLEVLLAHHPLREALWAGVMVAFYREGRQADALGAYQRAREILADELGVDPSPELVRLHERILRQDPGLDRRGQALRAYRLLEKVSEGPRGVVFRAIQPRVERDVAVKVFHEAIASDPAFVRRFEQEAQAVAGLEHPHIVPIYDYWREPGRAYIVSRYLRGASLRALRERGQSLKQDRALRVVEQVASALAFAHAQGVAHGSVGSSNVLFDGEGNAYLGDFLVGVGPVPDGRSDVRELARLARGLLADGMPEPLHALVDEADLGKEPPGAEAFARAARAVLEPSAIAHAPRRDDVRNPYKGLRPFTEADARDFFGRGELTQRLVARLRGEDVGSRFLAVVGPSGSGKSSVVRAGLVPAIRQGALGDPERRFVAEMSPGAHPIDELEAALLRIAVRPATRLHETLEVGSRGLLRAVDLLMPDEAEVVLVVDQFEEAFTLCADERERERFLESLRVATADPDSRLRVVVTLRADFYDRPLTYPRFGELLAATTEAVPPLTPDELEQAIRKPAEHVGVSPEPGLVAEMIADVAHQPGALPLLQYALTELFERREDDRLTLRAHQGIGGVAGALSARADRILDAADPEGRRAIKQVFLRLVTLGEGTQDTRRRVVRSELDALEVKQEAIDGVLEAFGRHRFLTFDRDPSTREPTVEIAHEALLTAWGRLRGWIDEMREDLRQERRLARAAAEWQASERDASFLMHGVRLEQVASWQASTDLALGERERVYLKASLDERDREWAEEDERRRREAHLERRSRTRLRALVAVFAVATLVAGSLTVVATDLRERASREATIARARALASAAVANLEVDPELSVLLAIEAVEETRSVDGSVLREAEEALHQAVTASRVVMTAPGLGGDLDWSHRGVFVTEDPEGMIDIRDARTGTSVLSFHGHDGKVTGVAFSRDGSRLATTGDDGMLKVWNPSTGDLLASVRGRGPASGPSFSADGSLIAAGWKEDTWLLPSTPPIRLPLSTIRVLDLATDRVVWTHDDIKGGPTDTAFNRDGKRLAVINNQGLAVFDLETGDRPLRLRTGEGDLEVAWSPDARYIATTSSEAPPRIWDAETRELRDILTGHTGVVTSVAWSWDSSRLVTGGREVRVWDVDRDGHGTEVRSLSASEMSSGFAGVAFSPRGTRVMGGAADFTAVKTWDLRLNGDAEWANLPASGGEGRTLAEFLRDGHIVTTSRHGKELTVWDVQTRQELRTITPRAFAGIFALDVSPDGREIAAGGFRPTGPRTFGGDVVGVWDAATWQQRFWVRHHLDVNAVAFSPDGEYLVSGGWSRWAKVVDGEGEVIRVLKEENEGFKIDDVDFSSDGRLLATATSRGWENAEPHVNIWDWENGIVVRTIEGASHLELDPSGPRMATVVAGRAEIQDLESGERIARLAGTSGDISALAFSPDGSLVATGHEDGAVRLFEADTGNLRLALPGNAGAVKDVSFSPDGTMLASTSAKDGVRVWALDIDDLLEIARQDVTRPLTDEECLQYLHEDRCPPR